MTTNNGVINTGSGNVTLHGVILGQGNSGLVPADLTAPFAEPASLPSPAARPIGIVTVLSEEMRAVRNRMEPGGPEPRVLPDTGLRIHEGTMARGIPVVLVQTTHRGQRSALFAVQNLRSLYDPAVIVLVGISGLIRAEPVVLGDVVVATEMLYYDDRRIEEQGVVFRPQELPTHVFIRNSVNDFFAAHGEDFLLKDAAADGRGRESRVRFGKIGSGEAVVAAHDADPVRFLRSCSPKVLGIDTESGGLAQAFYEQPGGKRPPYGWLVIRGFSDHTHSGRSEAMRMTAAANAAAVLELMLPHLVAVPGAATTSGSGRAGAW